MDKDDPVGQAQDSDKQALLETWYDEYHRRTFGIGFHEAAGALPDLSLAFKRWCADTSIHEKICLDWRYCEKKKSIGTGTQLAAALADCLAPLIGFSTHGAFSVARLFIEHSFDSICECGK